MSDEYRHDLERRWHDETWCAIAGSPECGCGCIPVAEEIARAMCDRIDELEEENRRMREALEDIAVYGCGMLNQPATLNEPVETWLRRRIREYERRARAALS